MEQKSGRFQPAPFHLDVRIIPRNKRRDFHTKLRYNGEPWLKTYFIRGIRRAGVLSNQRIGPSINYIRALISEGRGAVCRTDTEPSISWSKLHNSSQILCPHLWPGPTTHRVKRSLASSSNWRDLVIVHKLSVAALTHYCNVTWGIITTHHSLITLWRLLFLYCAWYFKTNIVTME